MTSHGRPRPSRARCTKRRPSSPSCRPVCASFTRASSKAAGSAFRRISSARRSKPPTKRCSSSTKVCKRCCSSRRFATVNGGCSNARRRGMATGPPTVSWRGSGRAPLSDRWLVAVNYAANQSQCYVRVPLQDLGASAVRFDDLMGGGRFDREKSDLDARGLFLDVPAWGYHVFDVSAPGVPRAPAERASDRALAIHTP